VQFINNSGSYGGAVYSEAYSGASFYGQSEVTFKRNKAKRDGGAIYFVKHSRVLFAKSTEVIFHDNNAIDKGGAAYFFDESSILLDQLSTVTTGLQMVELYMAT